MLPAGSLQGQRAAVLSDRAEHEFLERTAVEVTAPPRSLAQGMPRPPLIRRSPIRGMPGRISRWHSFTAGALVGALAVLAGSMAVTGRPLPSLDPSWTESNQHVTDVAEQSATPGPEDMDGDDPRARDCVFDAVIRDQVPLLLPGGRPFGMLRLRHSAHCGASWGSALYANPRLYTVEIIADELVREVTRHQRGILL